MNIDGRLIGPGHPPLIVAEVSANHGGSLERALKLVEAVKDAGAEAIKFQTYTADTLTIDHDGPEFQINKGLWAGRTLYDLYQEAYTPWEWHETLFRKARSLGLMAFSTPFDGTAVEFLESLDVPAHKIASFECVDLELVRSVAATRKPVVLSTGMANLGEIEEAVITARDAGCRDLILMHCISAYPAPTHEANLWTLPNLRETFDVVAGLSDHTLGTAVSVAAVALGAAMIEKHVTLARADGGPDAAFSLEPRELRELVNETRIAYDALGSINHTRTESEIANVVFRRSVFVVRDMEAGDRFTRDNVRVIRPGNGLPPKAIGEIVGARATRSLRRGTPLDWSMVDRDGR